MSNDSIRETTLMRLIARYFIATTCFLVTTSSNSIAQEASPKTFYKRDYASAPGAAGREYERPNASLKNSKNSTGIPKQDSSSSSGKISSPERKKRRVVVSVYVNSLDKEHFRKVMEEVFSLHDSRRAFITTVQHIGDYHVVTPELTDELSKRNIMMVAVSEPPIAAKVTKSPAWIITTKDGIHITEGTLSLSSSINEYGEYDPHLGSASPDRSKVEGF